MRYLRGLEWGASGTAMKKYLYKPDQISYRLWMYCLWFSSKNIIQKAGCVTQAQALRLCCGAFKTTPVAALQVEVGEMPL